MLAIPCLASWTVSVAVDTRRSAAIVSAESSCSRAGARPVAVATASGVTFGIAPWAASGAGASTTVLRTRADAFELHLDDVAGLRRPSRRRASR